LEPEFVNKYFRPSGVPTVTAFAAYTGPLEPQDGDIRKEIKETRANPALSMIVKKYTDAELYDMIFHRTVMTTYWWVEPEIQGRNPEETLLQLEGVYQIARGIRPFDAIQAIPNLSPNLKINLVVAADDQYIASGVIKKYWNALPEGNRGYYITVYGSRHAMLQLIPITSAHISRLTSKPPLEVIPYGSEIQVFQQTNRIHYGRARYNLEDLINGKVFDEGFAADVSDLRLRDRSNERSCRMIF
jgi:hypothetical protein